MQGKELVDFIENIPALLPNFRGVYAINTLPRKLNKRNFFFCNTDLNTGLGLHWQCIVKNDSNELEYFDSLGLTSDKLDTFLKYNKIKAKALLYNETPVQPVTSDKCGLFCIYFAVHRLLNIDVSFNTIINEIFETNTSSNETLVDSFLS